VNKKVSIVMAAYNASAYIKEAIDSVLKQSYNHWELIVIDDGSTDDTYKLVDQYIDPRIRLIGQCNGGQCAATNAGLEIATGDLIMFLDSDDKLHEEKLSNQVACHANSNDISISRFLLFPDVSRTDDNALFQSMNSKNWIEVMLESGSYVANSCYLIPKSVIDSNKGYNVELSLNNDFEYFSRIVSSTSRIIFCPTAITYYRKQGNDSLSYRISTEELIKQLKARTLTYDMFLEKWQGDRFKKLISLDLARLIFTTFYKDRVVMNMSIQALSNYNKDNNVPVINNSVFGMVQRVIGFYNALWIKRIYTRIFA